MKLVYLLEPLDRIDATDYKLGDKAGQLSEAPVGSSGGIVTDQHFHFVRPLDPEEVIKAQQKQINELTEAYMKDTKELGDEVIKLRKLMSRVHQDHDIGEEGEQGSASDLGPDMAHLEEVIHPTA